MRWTEHPIVMIDTETTGLRWTSDRVIEVAAIAFRLTADPLAPEFLGSFTTLVNPGAAILAQPNTAEALSVNLISAEELKHAPPFSEAAAQLGRYLEGIAALDPEGFFSVSAFNAEFDHRMLSAEWIRTSLPMPAWLECRENWGTTSAWIDPLPWCRDANRYAKGGHGLAMQRERLGIVSEGQAHRALTDVQDAAKVLNWLANGGHAALKQSRDTGAPYGTLADLLEWQDVIVAGQNANMQEFFYKKKHG